ncbi:MAG: hypothetical protein LBC65_01045 [Oscillospiraceae bacterium]|nr:hypothetical protein [Oscillospiraceae bacterium]
MALTDKPKARLDTIETTDRMTLLMDYYGELLTARQLTLMQAYYHDNLSLSEIAESDEITRQAVRDVLVRSGSALEDYEAKIGFIARNDELQAIAHGIEAHLFELNELNQKRFRSKEVLDLCNKIYELLGVVKGNSTAQSADLPATAPQDAQSVDLSATAPQDAQSTDAPQDAVVTFKTEVINVET